MRKIETVFDAREAKYYGQKWSPAKRRGFIVRAANGHVVGICQTQKRALQFIEDSLNTEGWSINRELA